MLYQFPEILSYILIYLPVTISTTFSIAMLAFGYLIRKNNGYTYGLHFMISAIFSIVPNIIYFAVNYPFLTTTLFITLGLPVSLVMTIISFLSGMFTILNVISSIFLFISIYYVYQTHKIPREQQSTT